MGFILFRLVRKSHCPVCTLYLLKVLWDAVLIGQIVIEAGDTTLAKDSFPPFLAHFNVLEPPHVRIL